MGSLSNLIHAFGENLFNPRKVWDLGAQGGWAEELAHMGFVWIDSLFALT
jgi:hypothetical protein